MTMMLQMAEGVPGQVLQIPADILAGLLTTVNGLKKEVSLLQGLKEDFTLLQPSLARVTNENNLIRQDNLLLRRDIHSLQHYSLVRFRGFSSLPIEIRRMIWQLANDLPRIIPCEIKRVIDEDGARRRIFKDLASPLLHVCRESRLEVHERALARNKDAKLTDAISFFNPACNILWNISEDIKDEPWRTSDVLAHFQWGGHITTLAIPYRQWYNDLAFRDEERGLENLLNQMALLHVETVYVVLGEPSIAQSPDLIFVKPQENPKTMISLTPNFLQDFDCENSNALES